MINVKLCLVTYAGRIFGGDLLVTHQFADRATRLFGTVQEETVGSPFCERESTLVFCIFVTDNHCLELGFASKWKTCVSRRILYN